MNTDRSGRRLALVVLCCLLGGGATAQETGEEPAPGPTPLESWSSAELGVRLSPPRGWVVQTERAPHAVVMLAPKRAAVIAMQTFPVPGGPEEPPDLEALVDLAVASLKKNIPRFKLLSRRPATVDGRSATEVFFRGKTEGVQRRWIQTLLVHRGRQMTFMYAAPSDSYDLFLADYDQVVRSLRLSD